jgi:hypothetical protein
VTESEPPGEIDPRYSSDAAPLIPWAGVRDRFAGADVYWLSTVRPDGGPHVTPLISVWLDGAPHVCAGAHERKAKNLAENARCVLTTGCNAITEGMDVVIEGTAERAVDASTLARLADAFNEKYDWGFRAAGATLADERGEALVWRLRPVTAFAFAKGEPFSQTRWRF